MNPKNPSVSLIIPVYNVETYLRCCLESVQAQSLSDFEAICVNDGSTDGSRAILSEYASRDHRLIGIDQPNAGLSAARNQGLQAARGEYTCFLDSDDSLAPQALEKLYSQAKKDNLDVLLYQWHSFSDEPGVEKQLKEESSKDRQDSEIDGIHSGAQLFIHLIRQHSYNASACLKFLRLSFLRAHQLTFKEGILHEDELFTPQCLLQAERCSVTGEAFYNRRVRADSIMTQEYTHRSVQGYFSVFSNLLNFYQSWHAEPTLERVCRDNLFSQYRMAASIYQELSPQEKELVSFPESSIDQLLYELLIAKNDSSFTKELLFAQENYLSVKYSASFRIGRILTAIPRKLFRR